MERRAMGPHRLPSFSSARRRVIAVVLLAMALSACGGDDDPAAVTVDDSTDEASQPSAITLPGTLQQFWDDLVEALIEPEPEFLLAHLHPAVIDQYGADQCEALLSSMGPQVRLDVPVGISEKANWTMSFDGIDVLITDTYTIDYQRAGGGREAIEEIHIAEVDGDYRWFTDCGEPLEVPGGPSIQE